MWVRRIGQKGTSDVVVVPSDAMKALGWARGDFLYISLVSKNALVIRRFDAVRVPDSLIEAARPLPEIKYGR